MRAFKLVALWAVAPLIVVLAWIDEFRPSRIRKTLAHIRRPDARVFSDAKAWLSDRGYTLAAEENGRDPLAELRKDGTSVAIESDRGVWTVSAGPASDATRHLLDAWAACLGTEMPSLKEAPDDIFWGLRLQLSYLRTHLPSIEAACQPDRWDHTLQCLSRARRDIDARVVHQF